MKVIRPTRTGGPEILEYIGRRTRSVGRHDVLVMASLIGANTPEMLVPRESYPQMPPPPVIP